MGKYINFTEEQKRRAGSVDLEEFLRCRGERLITSGREKRLARDHSITVRGSEWYDHAIGRGGGPVSFVQRFYDMRYPDAVLLLLGGETGATYPSAKEKPVEAPKRFALPPSNRDMRRVYAYLMKQRRISKDVISAFARAGILYEDAEHHNCVFVGTDEHGVARHAHKRSTNSFGKAFRVNVEGSDPRYSFHMGGPESSLYVFEAPIDLMSYMTIYPDRWLERNAVACCGTSLHPVLKMLELSPQISKINLCLDHDKAGQEACERMEGELHKLGYLTERCVSQAKDWNEDLKIMNAEQEVNHPCQVMFGL